MKRLITALILIPIIVYVVLWGPLWLLYAVVATVCVICYHEYAGIARAHQVPALGPLGYAGGLLLLATSQDYLLVTAGVTLLALALAMRAADLSKSLPQAAMIAAGVIYIFAPLKCAVLIRMVNPHWLMYGLILSWIGDTGAYYVGRRWGRHKLAPRISPGKSREGAAASLAVAVAAGVWYLAAFIPAVPWYEAALLSAAVNMAGQFGDLAESAIKRGAGVKDSGAILPGHGGLLDRIDSTLFALPAVWLYVRATQL